MKLNQFATFASIATLIIFIVVVGYWLLMPYRIQGKISVSPIHDGSALLAVYDLPSKEAEVMYITLENDDTIVVPPFAEGQAKRRTLKISIPDTVPEGRYRVFLKVAIPVNPLRDAKVIIASDEFELAR